MKLKVAALLASVAILAGCMPGDDDDDYDRKKYPPGYGVTPIPAPKITKPTTVKPAPPRPAPVAPRKVK